MQDSNSVGGWERDGVGDERRESDLRERGGRREGRDEGQGHQYSIREEEDPWGLRAVMVE